MLKTIYSPALCLSIFTVCIIMTGIARAHPEMDKFGRDITSGPPRKMVLNAVYDQTTTEIITQSPDTFERCDNQASSACQAQMGPDKKKWFRGED